MIFAIDFDGTLCVDRYPEIGEPREDMIRAVLDAQRAGDRFILWTCRIGERLEEAVAWSAAQGLTFDAVNNNLPDMIALYGNDCRKVFADGYIDDRNTWNRERGVWKKIGDGKQKRGGIFWCSACRGTYPYITRFCPNCGADMRKESGAMVVET